MVTETLVYNVSHTGMQNMWILLSVKYTEWLSGIKIAYLEGQ